MITRGSPLLERKDYLDSKDAIELLYEKEDVGIASISILGIQLESGKREIIM
jgi:hypothetical protein